MARLALASENAPAHIHHLPRSNLVGEDPAVLWERYVQRAQIEAAFKVSAPYIISWGIASRLTF